MNHPQTIDVSSTASDARAINLQHNIDRLVAAIDRLTAQLARQQSPRYPDQFTGPGGVSLTAVMPYINP